MAAGEEAAMKMARAADAPADKRRLLVDKGRLPKPGEGPSAEQRAKSWFKFIFVAEPEGLPAKRLVGSVSGGDPGYTETAKMVAEAALILARRRTELPATAGFLTPATAFGALYRERLQSVGIAFEQLEASVLPASTGAGASKL